MKDRNKPAQDRLVDEQRAICRHCGHELVWYFDREPDANNFNVFHNTQYGFWYDAEHMTEVCGGASGNPAGDLWHEPASRKKQACK